MSDPENGTCVEGDPQREEIVEGSQMARSRTTNEEATFERITRDAEKTPRKDVGRLSVTD